VVPSFYSEEEITVAGQGKVAVARGEANRWVVNREQFYIWNPFLFFIFFHTLPPLRLYIISLFYIYIWNPFLFFIFFRTLPPPMKRAVSQGEGRSDVRSECRTKR
jgi:hypothetical protein